METVKFGVEAQMDGDTIREVTLVPADGKENMYANVLWEMNDLMSRKTGVWNDGKLKEWNGNGGITVDGNPYAAKISHASVDLALDNKIRRARWWWRNPITRWLYWNLMPKSRRDIRKNTTYYWQEERTEKTIVLWPGDFVLCSSIETVTMPADAVGIILSKSTTGRIGAEHCHSGWIDSGFNGIITYEFFNPSPWPIELYPNDFYLQLVIMDMNEASEVTYNGRYQGQVGPTAARMEKVIE